MANKFSTKKNEGVTASSLFALDSKSGHSKIYDELCDIVDRVSYSGVLNAEDATDEYPDAVDVEFEVTSEDSAPYSVMVYIYGKEENDEESQLSYSVHDEYNNNLKDYISAVQGAPLGYQKGYKISELSQMWDDIEKDIQTLVSNADTDESKQKEAKKHTCSMQKKKEALAKKSEANVINLLDDEELTKSIEGIYRDAWKECCDSADEQEKPYYEGSEWYIEEFTPMTVESTQKSMYDYVAGGKYSMPGNFKQIDMDWDHDHEGGIKFSDLKKKLLAGTQDKDTEEFSHWGIDWFFDAFGTFGLDYNFKEALTDNVYDEMREDGVVESKKQEADGEDSQATYEVCFDYVQTMCQSVKANSVEDAVEKARRLISKDMQVCEIWCNEKTLPNGTKVYLDGKDSDEQSYTEGGWGVV